MWVRWVGGTARLDLVSLSVVEEDGRFWNCEPMVARTAAQAVPELVRGASAGSLNARTALMEG